MVSTLVQVHAICMILSFITFGSTGILIARYARSLRFGTRRQLLGKAVWFQIHRFLLSISSLLILLGFVFAFARAGGQWVNPQTEDLRLFAHSILGGIIICCTMIQIWLALYRCNPHSRFRFIFNWSHRITGLLAFTLSIPTIFLIIYRISKYRTALIIIVSLWTIWIAVVVIIFEKIEHKKRVSPPPTTNNIRQDDRNQENINTNSRPDTEANAQTNVGSQYHNTIKLLLLLIHIVISIILSVLLIVYICK
ncbi:unnamed protein product [Rotaria sp. Silwood2]|nr:unnamed protein product [Rotaria sp. Silwood2]CAF2667924.1 unnamed protein product [Rotaria sp. Silwood2]CAF3202525.1 unnamed protein product [Rotaria sp. Silwood2]CAF3890436.1 unnamed protein product [Rotaria sp. Silwood2]CAF3979702.1 unnamed protein product [Rotaria sp. Silwood2]